MPKISVVMSVYEEPVEWMRQSIDSILNQTYKDFEFIIVNDKPDREENAQLLNEYVKKDNRIKIITNEQNVGLTKSLNKGLKVAKGEYIARMDADDISMPERFHKQVLYFETHPSIKALGAQIELINGDGSKIGIRRNPCEVNKLDVHALFMPPLFHPISMFVREYKNQLVEYDETIRYSQDFALWSSFSIGERSNIDEFLLQYRVAGNQISTKKRVEQFECSNRIQLNNLKAVGVTINQQFVTYYNALFNDITIENKNNKGIQNVIKELISKLSRTYDRAEVEKYVISKYLLYLRNNYALSRAICLYISESFNIRIFYLKHIFLLLFFYIENQSTHENSPY